MTEPGPNDATSPLQSSSAPLENGPSEAASSAQAANLGAPNVAAPNVAAPLVTPSPKPKSPLWWWLLGIACVLGVELFVYGHNGWVRVCVGLQGVTDLSLLDRPKHRDGMKGFPICAEQLNLGMYSRSQDAAQEALELACGRGATLLHGTKQECLRKEHGWLRRVDKSHIPPWDERLYRRLFFLD